MNLDDHLRSLDPAKSMPPIGESRRARHLAAVTAVVSPPAHLKRRTERSPRRLIVLASVAVAAGIAVASTVVLAPSLLSGAKSPVASSARPTVLTVGDITASGVEIINDFTAGPVQLVLGRRDEETRLGASIDGSDPDDSWELANLPPVAASEISAYGGNLPDAGDDGIAYLWGAVGDHVTAVSIRTVDGQTVDASVRSGYFLAAWGGRDFTGRDLRDVFVTIRQQDGSVTTTPVTQISP